jgi:hypothetical protein
MDWYDESDAWRRGISSNADWGITPQINYFSFFTAIFRCHGCLFTHILYMFCRKKCTHIWNQTHKVYVQGVRYRWAPAGSIHYFQNMLNLGFTVLLSATNIPHEYAVLLLKTFGTNRRWIWIDCTYTYFMKIMDVVWIQTGMYILLLLLRCICIMCIMCRLRVLHLYKICKYFDRTCVLVCGFLINGNLWFYVRALTLLEQPQSVFVFGDFF